MDEERVPVGTDFLDLARDLEAHCEARTDEALPHMGSKAPRTFIELGTVLSLLDRVASCYWGCFGGDHVVELLTARASSNSRGALRLVRAGFYDEALGLSRGVGEVCNLLTLFALDRSSLEDWRTTDPVTRRKRYSAFSVRKRLQERHVRAIIQEDRYGMLSGFFAHPDPANPPQAHNIVRLPSTGCGLFQEAGLLVSLNELALAAGGVLAVAGSLARLSPEIAVECHESGKELIRSLGRVEVVTYEAMWRSFTSSEEP